MLDRFPTHTTLPASDMERAKAWYREKLEMVPKSEDAGGAYYESGGRSFALFQTPYAGTAQNTAMEWSVDDVEAATSSRSPNRQSLSPAGRWPGGPAGGATTSRELPRSRRSRHLPRLARLRLVPGSRQGP
jgi:catechol 2,3-dioxygenase-like lactoylglutathione lyase family enzyme